MGTPFEKRESTLTLTNEDLVQLWLAVRARERNAYMTRLGVNQPEPVHIDDPTVRRLQRLEIVLNNAIFGMDKESQP